MSDWESYIGKFPNLTAAAFMNELAKAYYQALLGQKDKLVEMCHYDEDPFFMYETLSMVLNPKSKKKGDKGWTYRGMRKVTDPDLGTTEEEDDIAMKKYITVTGQAKSIFRFLLCSYFKVAQDYYISHNRTFPEENKLMSELIKYSLQVAGNPIIPFVVKCTELFDIKRHVPHAHVGIENKMSTKASHYFKDLKDVAPNAHLGLLAEQFMQFMHILSLKTANTLFPARRAVNMPLILGFIYDLNTMVEESGASLPMEYINTMKE
jgi:hypothetical protein